jgi:hypothetical protein
MLRPVTGSRGIIIVVVSNTNETARHILEFSNQKRDYLFFMFFFIFLAQKPNACLGRLILEACRSHTITHHSR